MIAEEQAMNSVERKTVYFNVPGEQNTDLLLRLVKDYAEAEGIRDVVVASTTGRTGVKASKILKGFNVVVVTHHVGMEEPGVSELEETNRERILENGAKVLTATHALSGVERAVRKKFGTIQLLELISHTLRLFGEGMKVAVEISRMAADAGLIPADRDVISIAGTSSGADTALRVKPANSARFFDLKVREIIAKPRNGY